MGRWHPEPCPALTVLMEQLCAISDTHAECQGRTVWCLMPFLDVEEMGCRAWFFKAGAPCVRLDGLRFQNFSLLNQRGYSMFDKADTCKETMRLFLRSVF